jgi:hypothetical protein
VKVRIVFITRNNVDLIYKDAEAITDDQIMITFINGVSVVVQICRIPFLPLKPFLRLKKPESFAGVEDENGLEEVGVN